MIDFIYLCFSKIFPHTNQVAIYMLEKTHNLFVDLIGVRQFVVDRCAMQRWEGHGLHGNKLDFVGESPACIGTARHPVNVFKDGG